MDVDRARHRAEIPLSRARHITEKLDGDGPAEIDILDRLHFPQQGTLVAHAGDTADHVVKRDERKAEPKAAQRNGEQFPGEGPVGFLQLVHDLARRTDMTMK